MIDDFDYKVFIESVPDVEQIQKENAILKYKIDCCKLKFESLENENFQMRKNAPIHIIKKLENNDIANKSKNTDILSKENGKLFLSNNFQKEYKSNDLQILNNDSNFIQKISKEDNITPLIRRAKITEIDKESIICAYKNGPEWVELSKSMGIKYHTAYSIIKKWEKNGLISSGKIGGYKKRSISDAVGRKLIDFIQSNNVAFLKDMQSFLLVNHNVCVSIATISNYLDGKCLVVKRGRDIPEELNSDATKDKRFNYLKYIFDNSLLPNQCIYIGEIIFNLWLKRPYGHAMKGTECFRVSFNKRRRNMSLCMAIKCDDIVHYQVQEDSSNSGASFQEFVSELSLLLGDKRAHFMIDDRISHNDIEVENSAHTIVYLPPHSSFLNPVEAVFRDLMSAVNVVATSRSSSMVRDTRFISDRRRRLVEVIKEQINVIRLSNIEEHYRHCTSYYARCIRKEDILDS